MAHWLFLPNDAIKDIETLAALSPEKLAEFRRFLDSRDYRPSYTSYVRAAELLGLSDETAGSFCGFINYVQKQRTQEKTPREAVLEELERFVKIQRRDDLLRPLRERRAIIADLFGDWPVYEFSSKVRGLEAGPLPHLHNFRTFCDLRPVYNKEGSKIASCFPVITCWLVTHASESDETKETLFQLTEDDIKELTDQFIRLEKKLAEFRNRFSSFLAKKDEE